MCQPKIYGLIGYPVKHSLSPVMHNAAFRAMKINAQYRLFPLKEEEIPAFIRGLRQNNIYGLNVTVPYKEKIIPFLDKLSKEAGLIGAVNTIKVFPDRLEGFNTDGQGFITHLTKDLGFSLKSKSVAILGAGGASRAISVYLSKAKPGSIAIYDIDKVKLNSLVNYLKENFKDVDFKCADSIEELNLEECNLLINATPIGMKKSGPCLVKKEMLHKNLWVYDLIYNPPETKLLSLAKKIGARASSGLGMLLYQGMLSFELWIVRKAPKKVMEKALKEAIYK